MRKFLKAGCAALALILGSTSLAVAYDAEHPHQTRPTTQIGAVIAVADDDDNSYRWRQHQPRWQSGWDDDDSWDDEDDDDDGRWDDDDDDD